MYGIFTNMFPYFFTTVAFLCEEKDKVTLLRAPGNSVPHFVCYKLLNCISTPLVCSNSHGFYIVCKLDSFFLCFLFCFVDGKTFETFRIVIFTFLLPAFVSSLSSSFSCRKKRAKVRIYGAR